MPVSSEDKQIAKEIMIAIVQRRDLDTLLHSKKEEENFEAVWSRIIKSVAAD